MRITILHNYDFAHLASGPARSSQDSVLRVVAAFEEALMARQATVAIVPIGADLFSFAAELKKGPPDLVVNLCESLGGSAAGEMLIPGMLELMGLPYTGSSALSLMLALHKQMAKSVLRDNKVPTPDYALVRRIEDVSSVTLPFPVIVKPVHEDASVGIDSRSLVESNRELRWACERILFDHRQPALVERYIDGRELNVALLGEPLQALPIAEIDFSKLGAGHPRIVTYAAKWDESSHEFHATPPVSSQLPSQTLARVVEVAKAAFAALECRDYGRVDIRLAQDGTPYVIEVNPNCDLSPDAGFARAAKNAGMSYEALVWRLVDVARERQHADTTD